MDELKKYIKDGKGALIRIMNVLEHNELKIPVHIDLSEMLDTLKYMSGYVDCLEKFGVKLKDD
jgi:hypothetical protein